MKRLTGIAAVVMVSLAAGLFLVDVGHGGDTIMLDPKLPRVSFEPASSSVASVVAADWVEGHLYLLDASLAQVVVMDGDGKGWREIASFGSEGSGPGEFRWPQDLLWLPELQEILVLSSDGRVHHFSRDGSHIRDETVHLPCTLARGTLAPRAGGRFWLAGDCSFPTASGDTVFAVVFGEDRSGVWNAFARRPRFTMDGRYGTAYGLRRPVGTNDTSLFLNAGNDLCFTVLGDRPDEGAPGEPGGGRSPEELCLEGRRFSVPEPDDFDSRRLPAGRAFSWPDPLPSHSAMGAMSDRLFLVRMFSADSVFLESRRLDVPHTPGRELAVGPIQGLVGCRDYGCLWFRTDPSGNRLGLLLFSSLLENAEDEGGTAEVR